MARDVRAQLHANFARRMKDRRVELGMRQEDLAAAIGRHSARISRLEAGEGRADLAEAILIARALQISVEALVADPR